MTNRVTTTIGIETEIRHIARSATHCIHPRKLSVGRLNGLPGSFPVRNQRKERNPQRRYARFNRHLYSMIDYECIERLWKLNPWSARQPLKGVIKSGWPEGAKKPGRDDF